MVVPTSSMFYFLFPRYERRKVVVFRPRLFNIYFHRRKIDFQNSAHTHTDTHDFSITVFDVMRTNVQKLAS